MLKLEWFGLLGVTQGHQQHNHLIDCTMYKYATYCSTRNYASIFYRFRVIAGCLSKVAPILT